MSTRDELKRENAALRARITALAEAARRINSSLDLRTVLRAVVESACALTGSSSGGIVTLDEAGKAQKFISFGLSLEERRRIADWTEASLLLELLRDLSGPLTVEDVPAYLSTRGVTDHPLPFRSLHATPLHHRGEHIGNFYLAEKEDGQAFTEESEEVLVQFASQAATAIANAHTHPEEQRARTNLEALVETSPYGVVVLDAATGRAVSLNREARRISEALRGPGQTVEELIATMTCQRSDGREISLRDFLPAGLDSVTALRAEEIVLLGPTGRRMTTLINATPLYTARDKVMSVVVTLQDLAPMEEVERLRAQFVSMVSHELRAPLTSIKGSAATLMNAASSLAPAEMREYFRIIDEQAENMRNLIGDLLDAGDIEAGTLSVAPEPSEVAALVERARNTFLSSTRAHTVQINLPPDLPPVMVEQRRIVQVLNNLLSNASANSPDAAPIRVSAAREGVHVAITVADEGRGIAPERLPQLFRKYSQDGDADHRIHYGLGLAICKGLVEAHGGRIWAESAGTGTGARFTFTLPVIEQAPHPRGADAPPREQREQAPVLVVDDDPRTLRFVRDALTQAGFRVRVTGDHRELGPLIRSEKPCLVLLDLVLPGIDGIELLGRVGDLADIPVIFISGYGRDETIARALESGAADYIVKPFSPTELTARIRAALRLRANDKEPFVLGELAIDYDRRRVTLRERTVKLTAKEYELLRVLSMNAGRVLTFDVLMRQVWRGRAHPHPALVRTFVKRIRRKLGEDAQRPAYIINERGVGYRMSQPAER